MVSILRISLILLIGFMMTISKALAQPSDCNNIFFSQYIEGSSFNKLIELYNPTSRCIDLSNYTIQLYNNGSTFPNQSYSPNATIPAKGTFGIVNSQADSFILNKADVTSGITNFNGDDVIVLLEGGDTLDMIGVIGNEPSSGWQVGNEDTKDNTLVRADTVQKGTKNWQKGATQWDTYPQDDTTNLARHINTTCPAADSAEVVFAQSSLTVVEDSQTVAVALTITNPKQAPSTLEVSVTGGSADSGKDYNISSPVSVTFPGCSDTNQTVNLSVLEDSIDETSETVILSISNIMSNAVKGPDSTFTLTIQDDDLPDSFEAIGDYNSSNASCEADSAGTSAAFEGIVTSTDYRNSGVQFFIQGPTGGIAVIDSLNSFGYQDSIQQGDRFQVVGQIAQSKGLIYVQPDTIKKVSATNSLPSPSIITTLDESTESERIAFLDAWLVNPSAWTGTGKAFDVLVTNGPDTLTARIDSNTGFYNMPPLSDTVDLIGVGSQSSQNPCSGYEFYLTDTLQQKSPVLSLAGNDTTVTETGGPVTFTVQLTNPDLSATVAALDTILSPAATSNDIALSTDSVQFPAGLAGSQTITVSILDNAQPSPDKTAQIELTNPSGNATINDSLLTITIEDDDQQYTIGEVNNTSGPDCIADSIGEKGFVTGVVHSMNFTTSGYDFYLQDSTGGINVFSFDTVTNYSSVTIGDELRIKGEIDQFNGKEEIVPDSIELLSTGNALYPPDTITNVSETNQGEHVAFANSWLIDPQNWNDTSNAGFNVHFYNGTDTINARVDANSPLSTTPAPIDTLTIRGIATQFDDQAPYCSGHQLLVSEFDTVAEATTDTMDDDTTSIKAPAKAEQDIIVYPNPATDQLHLQAKDKLKDARLTLYDVRGRKLRTIEPTEETRTVQIDLHNISHGIYLLTIREAETFEVKKIRVVKNE